MCAQCPCTAHTHNQQMNHLTASHGVVRNQSICGHDSTKLQIKYSFISNWLRERLDYCAVDWKKFAQFSLTIETTRACKKNLQRFAKSIVVVKFILSKQTVKINSDNHSYPPEANVLATQSQRKTNLLQNVRWILVSFHTKKGAFVRSKMRLSLLLIESVCILWIPFTE